MIVNKIYRSVDFLTITFFLFLLYLTLLFHLQIPDWISLIKEYLFLLSILILILLGSATSKGLLFDLLHSFYPIIFIPFIFNSLSRLIPYVNPYPIDPFLIRIDYHIFSNHPTILLEKITFPLLTDIFQLAYTTYYFLPTLLAVIFYQKKNQEIFDTYVTTICLTYYLSYIGYIFFPAVGPRFTLAHLQCVELKGLFLANPISEILNLLEELKYDAFPSGHTAVMLVTLSYSLKLSRKTFLLFLFPTILLIFSTVYCRYHYFIDVVAGIVLAFFSILLGPRIHLTFKNLIRGL